MRCLPYFSLGLGLALCACGSTTSNSSAGGSGNAGSGGAGSAGAGAGGAAAGGSAAVQCTDVATATGHFTEQYASADIPVTGIAKSYFAQSNWWHVYNGQTIDYKGLSFTVNDPNGTSVPRTDGAPTGFPSLFIGAYSGNMSRGSHLPKQVSALTSVPTIFKTNALAHDTSNYNATYDVWFTASGDPLPNTAFSPGAGGAYLMVWLYKPAARQPRGGIRGAANVPAQTIPGMPGTWDIWVDLTSPPCISYVSTTPVDSLSFDLNSFIQDAVTNRRGITSTMYLSLVFAGFEIWGGGNGLSVEQYCATVN